MKRMDNIFGQSISNKLCGIIWLWYCSRQFYLLFYPKSLWYWVPFFQSLKHIHVWEFDNDWTLHFFESNRNENWTRPYILCFWILLMMMGYNIFLSVILSPHFNWAYRINKWNIGIIWCVSAVLLRSVLLLSSSIRVTRCCLHDHDAFAQKIPISIWASFILICLKTMGNSCILVIHNFK